MQCSSFSKSLSGVAHASNYGRVVRADAAGAVALAVDATTQQPGGIIQGGDHYDTTQCNVVIAGPAKGVVGAAGLAAGFNFLTCDAASKIKAAAAGDAVVGYTWIPAALTEDQTVELVVQPNPGEPAP